MNIPTRGLSGAGKNRALAVKAAEAAADPGKVLYLVDAKTAPARPATGERDDDLLRHARTRAKGRIVIALVFVSLAATIVLGAIFQ